MRSIGISDKIILPAKKLKIQTQLVTEVTTSGDIKEIIEKIHLF